jgi:hypothetical protein
MKRRRTKLKQILSLLKNNQKLDLNNKIENYKTLKKEPRKKKEIKSKRTESKNIIYTN